MPQEPPETDNIPRELHERIVRAIVELIRRRNRKEKIDMDEFMEGHFLNSERREAEKAIDMSNLLLDLNLGQVKRKR